MTLAKQLKEHRQRTRQTQADFAKRLGVDQATVSAWERGRTLPNPKTFHDLAVVLGTSVTALLSLPRQLPYPVPLHKRRRRAGLVKSTT
jgi:transcriptional regulator with XRE-family HTH domain